MKISRHEGQAFQKLTPAFATGVVAGQPPSERLVGNELSLNVVRFEPGGRSHWHVHPFEQSLLITEGTGIVATEHDEHVVHAGDMVLVERNEKHWHGATESTGMTHIVVDSGSTGTTILEPVEKVQTNA